MGAPWSRAWLACAIAGKVGKVMCKFSQNEWLQFSQMLLDACTDQEGTDDLDYKGAIRIYITNYLLEVGLITPSTPSTKFTSDGSRCVSAVLQECPASL